MSSQLFFTLDTLYIYPSTHKQMRQHLPNPRHEFPCTDYDLGWNGQRPVEKDGEGVREEAAGEFRREGLEGGGGEIGRASGRERGYGSV